MDTDPPLTVDFIFFRVGHGKVDDAKKHLNVISSQRMGEKESDTDPTIKGSDHFPIVTEFEILPVSSQHI
jgi:hypothetical protein